MPRLSIKLVLLLMVTTTLSSCRRSSAPDVLPSVVAVEQVAAKSQLYDHKLLAIRGCYVAAFERSTLQPCQDTRINQAVWVEDAALPLRGNKRLT